MLPTNTPFSNHIYSFSHVTLTVFNLYYSPPLLFCDGFVFDPPLYCDGLVPIGITDQRGVLNTTQLISTDYCSRAQ